MFQFIHAADLHIDSPLRKLEAYEGAPADQLRAATREAFANLVTLAIERQVAFVVIAGDLFDGSWQDMRTGLWTAGQFRRLARENIPVYLLRGNHDAASKVQPKVTWPENVHEFSVRKPQTLRIESLGVALHGQGFAHQECDRDLAADYPPAVPGCFNIGVLHTSLTGSSEHDTYAATSEDVLVGKGYDYWALGHIHQRSDPPIRRQPYIAYSGNTQGRHIRETGPKGCLLVTVDDGEVTEVEFQPTDVLRWHLVQVPLEPTDGLVELRDKTEQQLAACLDASDGRLCAVRLVLQGPCGAHRQLVDPAKWPEIQAELRNQANSLQDEVWLEKILVETSPPVDWTQLQAASDLLGELLRDVSQLESNDEGLQQLRESLAPLVEKAALELREAEIEYDSPEQLRRWLRDARSLLAGQLWEGTS